MPPARSIRWSALLQGKLAGSVMARLCQAGTGLFPAPSEITMSCSCPDRASMCKHIAAVLYGIGARLDHEPALLFTLRKVKEADLVARAAAGTGLTSHRAAGRSPRIEDETSLGAIFGLDIASAPKPAARARKAATPKARSRPRRPR